MLSWITPEKERTRCILSWNVEDFLPFLRYSRQCYTIEPGTAESCTYGGFHITMWHLAMPANQSMHWNTYHAIAKITAKSRLIAYAVAQVSDTTIKVLTLLTNM